MSETKREYQREFVSPINLYNIKMHVIYPCTKSYNLISFWYFWTFNLSTQNYVLDFLYIFELLAPRPLEQDQSWIHSNLFKFQDFKWVKSVFRNKWNNFFQFSETNFLKWMKFVFMHMKHISVSNMWNLLFQKCETCYLHNVKLIVSNYL